MTIGSRRLQRQKVQIRVSWFICALLFYWSIIYIGSTHLYIGAHWFRWNLQEKASLMNKYEWKEKKKQIIIKKQSFVSKKNPFSMISVFSAICLLPYSPPSCIEMKYNGSYGFADATLSPWKQKPAKKENLNEWMNHEKIVILLIQKELLPYVPPFYPFSSIRTQNRVEFNKISNNSSISSIAGQ